MAHDILIVDDEEDIRVLTAGILEDEGHQVRTAADSASALASIEVRRPNLVLLDIWLQGSDLDGLGILKEIKKDHINLPVLMMSGHGTVETAVKAIKFGAYDFIEKPFKSDRLINLVTRSIEAAQLRRENEELKLRVGSHSELIGTSNAVNHVRQIIEKVAPANSRVLISGPSGSGKEVAAQMLHNLSRRADGPFVVVNCATMEPDRMEEELFGTETPTDGSDTPRKVGTFEQAHNGTLFLDEVGDMPLETQGKIVRVLQEQIFTRVGGTTKVEVDVRVVASSTYDLADEIKEGRFREDLYYRLCVVPIEIPSLRDRREDIPLLAVHFMTKTGETTGQAVRQIGDDAIAALQSYDWSGGNVRELRNVIERMLIMAPEESETPIGTDSLPDEIMSGGSSERESSYGAEVIGLPLREARKIFERDYLLAQVTRFGGNISRTANFIGMERSALHRKLKSLEIKSEE
jgi:two-component system, NtrC family, nitrogen regulation response regulator NtrX